MAMTMAQKILARHSGRDRVAVGEYVTAKIDYVLIYESFLRIEEGLKKAGIDGGLQKVWDKDRVVSLIHYAAPALDKNIATAKKHVEVRNLVKKLGLPNFYDVNGGVCHQVMIDKGFALPGKLVVVSDSHATTYGALNCGSTGIGETEMAWVLHFGELWFQVPGSIKIEIEGKLNDGIMAKDIFLHVSGSYGTEMAQYKSIEWAGLGVDHLSLDGRLCLSNQAVEIGAKFSLFDADETVFEFLEKRAVADFEPVQADPKAHYEAVYSIDAEKLEPLVAEPHGMDVVHSAGFYRNVKINQATIGGCSNGRLEDLAIAARVFKGKKVNPEVRCIAGPASWEVYRAALRAGYLETLIDAGVIVCHPFCGPCTGTVGTLAPGEVCITATSRNFKGRMGSPDAFIYLASPATVAASAVRGYITDPREML